MVVDYCQECGCSACQCGGSTSWIVPSWPDVADRWMKACMEHEVTIADLRERLKNALVDQNDHDAVVRALNLDDESIPPAEEVKRILRENADLRERIAADERIHNDVLTSIYDREARLEKRLIDLRERHEVFVRKVRGEAQRAEDLATCTSLTSYLANEILALCDAELGKEQP